MISIMKRTIERFYKKLRNKFPHKEEPVMRSKAEEISMWWLEASQKVRDEPRMTISSLLLPLSERTTTVTMTLDSPLKYTVSSSSYSTLHSKKKTTLQEAWEAMEAAKKPVWGSNGLCSDPTCPVCHELKESGSYKCPDCNCWECVCDEEECDCDDCKGYSNGYYDDDAPF
jgi:hypothetical protein